MYVVWKAETRAEAAHSSKRCAAAVTMDTRKYYEIVQHQQLADRAMALDYPLPCLRAALRGYAMTRYIVHMGASSEGLATRQGIPAGDGFATSLVKAHVFIFAEKMR